MSVDEDDDAVNGGYKCERLGGTHGIRVAHGGLSPVARGDEAGERGDLHYGHGCSSRSRRGEIGCHAGTL